MSTGTYLCLSLYGDHTVVFDCKRELAVLESESFLAKQLASPARECRHIGFVVSRDAVEIVHSGDDLGRHAVSFCRHPQEHFEQLKSRLAVGRSLGALDFRQSLHIAREPTLD